MKSFPKLAKKRGSVSSRPNAVWIKDRPLFEDLSCYLENEGSGRLDFDSLAFYQVESAGPRPPGIAKLHETVDRK